MITERSGHWLMAVVVAVGLLIGAGPSVVRAQGVLYDDFSSKELDASKWFAVQVAGGSFSGSPLELTRRIRGGHGPLAGKLELSHRMVGGQHPATGVESKNRMALRAVPTSPPFIGLTPNVAGLQFDVIPAAFEARGCPDAGIAPTRARMGFNYHVFNDPGIPYMGGSTGNMGAIIELRRDSHVPGPHGFVRAVGTVYRCLNPECSTSDSTNVELGLVARHEEVQLRIQWEPELDAFSFQKGAETPVLVSYAAPPFNVDPGMDELAHNPQPQGFSFRVLEVRTVAPTCQSERTEAEMTALIDNVVVLPLMP